jgi:acid phosphatase family membrane protein YuiD
LRDLIVLNPILFAALLSWFIAQSLKIPFEYIQSRTIDWSLLLKAGGMPSSHSALVTSTAYGVGLFTGFDTPLFAASVVLAVIVIYDAIGVRREAGRQAALLNQIMEDFATGKFKPQERLKEVLGHTPTEVFSGMFLGLLTAFLVWRSFG